LRRVTVAEHGVPDQPAHEISIQQHLASYTDRQYHNE
jgi:hypothetical protein